MTTKQEFPIGPRELIGGLLDYAERYADLNNEPADGACREAIRKGQAWFESGSATVDISDVGLELAEYVTKFAEINDEPKVGNCRRLLSCAASTYQPRKMTTDQQNAVQAARERVIDALITDQLNSHAGDSDCFKAHGSLADVFRNGFRGFDGMTLAELIQSARDGGVAEEQSVQIGVLQAALAGNCPGLSRVTKTVLQFTVLHDDSLDLASMPLNDIAHLCDEGGYVGGHQTVVSSQLLTKGELEAEAVALGSDATFFDLDEEDVDAEPTRGA